MSLKVSIFTLGCKVNQRESAALSQMFCDAGWQVVSTEDSPDIFVVNSCTVTAAGEAKSRRAMSRAKKQNPNIVTVLTGCFPQAFPQKAESFGADVTTGTSGRTQLTEHILRFVQTKSRVLNILPSDEHTAFEELPQSAISSHTRAFVKVQDGCNRRCAYCIIPTARGPARSRDKSSILQEIDALAQKGYAEVVLTGINLSCYGQGTDYNLASLAQAAAKTDIQRIRFSSLEPDLVSDEDIASFAQNPKLCHHFHLSLQSGSDAVLKRMGRLYTTAQYAAVAKKLRNAMPSASLTTDLIVGFPGESEQEFEQSLEFVRKMRFLRVHVFPYSAREGTPAAKMPHQLPRTEKERRAKLATAVAKQVCEEWIAQSLGGVHRVLLESRTDNGDFTGYTENYIPVVLKAGVPPLGGIAPATKYDQFSKESTLPATDSSALRSGDIVTGVLSKYENGRVVFLPYNV